MGILVVTEFVTLDGVAQAPGGPEEDLDGGFAYGGWQAPLLDAASGEAVFEQAQPMDALLLGRRTYDLFAGYWPTAPAAMPFTALMNRVPKHVASRGPIDHLTWENSTQLGADLSSSVRALKAEHEQINVIGSLDLVQSLLREDLVDRWHLWQYPVLLGSGKKLFGDGTVPRALRLTESVTHQNGTVQLVYENAGTPTVGDMTVEAEEILRPE